MHRRVPIALSLVALGLAPRPTAAQHAPAPDSASTAVPKPRFERISFRGYVQVRYNRLLENNEKLICTQCDRSMGHNGGIFLRRIRFTLEARPSDRVTFVLQPDFTAEAGEANGIAQVRDAYVEVALDDAHAWRLRFGQTFVPYGWENLVSSAKRVAFDRVDALNSAIPTERDLGAFAYWTPRVARERFRALAAGQGKGTGDLGVVSFAAFNGQTANRPEQNDNLHVALRLAWPFALPRGQFLEAGLQGYTGRYVVTTAQRTAGVVAPTEFTDQRAAAFVVLHPRPVGIQAEWNVGRGPEADPAAHTISEQHLDGGYVLAMLRTMPRGHQVIPYVRAQRYDGAKKFELDARRHQVREIEGGVEWTVSPEIELTTAFMAAERNTADLGAPESRQQGHRLRLQAQFVF